MRLLFLLLFASCAVPALAQLKSGPMLGHVDFRTATIWVEFENQHNIATARCRAKGNNTAKWITAVPVQKTAAEPYAFTKTYVFTGLEPNTTYEYELEIQTKAASKSGNKSEKQTGEFTTDQLWQWRTDPPDFSFLTGSCAYFNQPQYDRPGKPYGNDSAIFQVMAKVPASFMLWLGDNWYTREVDYYSDYGLYYRASITRNLPILKNFWKAMPHYAIWDDHDYGWNDADKSYPLKQTSRKVFMDYWTNPSYGEDGEGVYTKITKNDVDFFLLDDRWWRSAGDLADSIDGRPNADKRMWGKKQMDWLKNALSTSNGNTNINFRIIVTGSQVLNPASPYDCATHYPIELEELENFIRDNGIKGILFLDGDRHHSEVIKVQKEGMYPLYDITASPLTSGISKFSGPEKNNPYRILGIEDTQNFSKITVSGKRNDRTLKLEYYNPKGDKLAEWSVTQKELSLKK